MKTTNLTRASRELFRRTPDECFGSLADLRRHCEEQRDSSQDRWHLPQEVVLTSEMTLCAGKDGAELELNDWSFSQLCRMAGVAKDTINRLSHKTASRALQETLPQSEKPLQILTTSDMVRSVHGVAYTRLWNADLLDLVAEFGSDFQPPQRGMNGGTGLYCGEQDTFCFLIDPHGWTDIDASRGSSHGGQISFPTSLRGISIPAALVMALPPQRAWMASVTWSSWRWR
jgi:hypothetical protein